MTSRVFRRILGFAVVAVLLGGCGSRQPRLASLGPDPLFEEGIAAYEAENYGRAIQYLERFSEAHLGDPRVPRARLALGRARMARGDYLLAALDFQRLATDFPSDTLAPEARFGICEAYTRLSPKPMLDQEYTRAAVEHCESVANLYPGTPEAQQAQEQVAELRERLAEKAYENGMFYFKRRAFDAAVIYFEDVAEQYSATSYAPAALLKLMESYDRIGYVEEATEARERLLSQYPESPEAQGLRA